MPIASINPATGHVLKVFESLSDADIESKLALATQTFKTYRHTSFDQRATWLRRVAQVLEDKS